MDWSKAVPELIAVAICLVPMIFVSKAAKASSRTGQSGNWFAAVLALGAATWFLWTSRLSRFDLAYYTSDLQARWVSLAGTLLCVVALFMSAKRALLAAKD